MAKLQSDSLGFLVGVSLDMNDLKRLWGRILRDVQAIRRAVEAGDTLPAVDRVGAVGGSKEATPGAMPVARPAAVRSERNESMRHLGRVIAQELAKVIDSSHQGAQVIQPASQVVHSVVKPAVELPKPAVELPKPAAELLKPVVELPKPAAELLKPVVELPKPAAELPKPVAEPSKQSLEPAATNASPVALPAPVAARVRDEKGRFIVAPLTPSAAQPVGQVVNSVEKSAASPDGLPAPVSARVRDEKGRFIVAVPTPSEAAVAQPVGQGADRDGRGRFTAKSGDGEGESTKGVIGRVGDRIESLATAITSSGAAQEVDPAIKAFNEVAQPMARGYQALFGGGASKEEKMHTRWYRRIWAQLKKSGDEQAVGIKAMRKSLKVIEEKPVGAGQSAGLFGSLGALGSGALTGLLGLGGGLLRGAGGMLKRVPLLGALLTGLGGLLGVFDSESSDMSRGDKDRATGRAGGGAAGALAGMWGGAKLGAILGSFAGPVGTAIGAVVGGAAGMFFGEGAGKILGETVGGWVTQLREADIPGKVALAWDSATRAVREAGEGMRESANKAFEFVRTKWQEATAGLAEFSDRAKEWLSNLWNAFSAAIKDKLGIDLVAVGAAAKEKVTQITNKVSEVTKPLIDKAAPVLQEAKTKIADTASKAVEGGKAVASKAAQGAAKVADYVQNETLIGKGATLMTASIKQAMSGTKQQHWEGGARDDIVQAANASGVDAGLLAKIAHFESGFNANAAPISKDASKNKVRLFDGRMGISSAHGYGQFLDGTWTEMLNKHGAKYGVEGAGKLTKAQANSLRSDTKLQAAMLAEFTKENMAKGRALGGADDDANVYAFHNLGDGDASRLLKGMKSNPSMSVRDALIGGRSIDAKERARIEQVIAGNGSLYGNGSISAAEAYARMGKVMRQGEAYAVDARNAATAGVAIAKIPQLQTPQPVATAAIAAAPAPASAPVAASAAPPAPKAAPNVAMNVATLDAGAGRGFVNPPLVEPGQDLSDRKLAHLATGGIGT